MHPCTCTDVPDLSRFEKLYRAWQDNEMARALGYVSLPFGMDRHRIEAFCLTKMYGRGCAVRSISILVNVEILRCGGELLHC
jgi:hypothetical protein